MVNKKYSQMLKNIGTILVLGALTAALYFSGKCVLVGVKGNYQKVKNQYKKENTPHQKEISVRFTPSQAR